jgi:hypothetical protein
MKIYNTTLTGYGIDILFLYALGIYKENKYVIVDYISCVNPKKKEREIDKLEPYPVRYNKWKMIQKSLKYEEIIHKIFLEVK